MSQSVYTSKSQRVNRQENNSIPFCGEGTALDQFKKKCLKNKNKGKLVYVISIFTHIFNEDHTTHYTESIGRSRLYFFLFISHLKTQSHGAEDYRKAGQPLLLQNE